MSAEPYFKPMSGSPVDSRQAQMHDAREASEIATREEMAYVRALGTPRLAKSELPVVRSPVLLDNFEHSAAELDDAIYKRGIAIDRGKLLELGKERFTELLEVDRKIPRHSIGAGVDVTQWQSVQRALHAFESAAVPARTTREQVTGHGKQREAVRKITGFGDLWKCTHERGEVLHDIYAFRDAFESLVFAQSILEQLSKDGRLRSRRFTDGKGRRFELLRDWRSVLQGEHSQVTLRQPLFFLMAWLSSEKATPPSHIELAREFFSCRAPSLEQIKLVRAIVDAFLRGYRDDWQLWEQVGRATRAAPDRERLAALRKALAAHFPRVSAWHEELRSCFNRDVNAGDVRYAHLQFDATACRAFIDSTVQELLDCMSALLAVGVEETFGGAVVARFEGAVLLEGKHKPADKRTQIARPLAMAFSGSKFELAFERLQS